MTLTREEILTAIRSEGLSGFRCFENATNETDVVAVQRTPDGWVVFATDERATPVGRREFSSEEPALENLLSRLRSLNSVAAWHANNREARAAERGAAGAGAVAGAGHSVDATPLLARVYDAITASDDLTISDLSTRSDGGATAYKSRLAASRPTLSSAAIDALASRWFFRLRWLGIESGQDAPRYFVRYGGEGASPIPIALYRRRTIDGVIVDEVLKDVGEWRADARRQIHNSFAFSLESDLEEVTAAEAAEFEEMVRAREYVPFTSTAAPR